MSGDERVAWPVRGPMAAGLLGLMVLLAGFGGWAGLTRISGAIIAPGRLEVDRNRQVVQHPDGGVVAAIAVEEGDRVRAGEVLLRLDGAALDSRLAIIETQLFEVVARRDRLAAERDGAPKISFDPLLRQAAATDERVAELVAGQARLLRARSASVGQEIDQLGKRRGQIRSQIEGIQAQRAALARQRTLISRELDGQQTLLDRGLAQATRVLGLRREAARLSGRMGELAAAEAQARGRMTEIGIEILKLEARRREEAIAALRDLRHRELELREERRALLERIDRLDLRAPVGGVVYDLNVHGPHAVVRPAEPLLYIVPQDRPLVIDARVDPIHVDSVGAGQEVVLRFPALDRRRAPELTGQVTRVSADAFRDEATGQRYYRAEIALPDGETGRLPDGVTLIPGMPVEAFIRTADRTPLAYLVKPLSDFFVRAFRD